MAEGKDPALYDGTPICQCCGDGWPCCAEFNEKGTAWTHAETCERYTWADDLCEKCDQKMSGEHQ